MKRQLNRWQDMINTYLVRQRNKSHPSLILSSCHPVFLSSCHPVILSSCHPVILSSCLLLALLLTACGSTAATGAQVVSDYEETAIENFVRKAPVAAKNADNALPMPAPVVANRIPLPEIDPVQIVENIAIAGNYTLFDLTNRLYVRFVADGYSGFIKLEELSNSEGFHAFCLGATDGVAATRPILQEELDSCLRLLRTPVVFPVGSDALVVVVNQANDFAQDVTLEQLAEIFKAKRWSDVNPAWPARKIVHILPLSTTDNFLFFADVVLQGNRRLLETAPNTSFLPDAIDIVQRVQDNPDAIGLLNYITYRNWSNALRLVKLGGLAPDLNTMQADTYPLRRPLLFYSATEVLQGKPQVAGFLTYYLTYVNEEIGPAGQFPLTRIELDRSRLNLLVGTANEAYLDELREVPKQ